MPDKRPPKLESCRFQLVPVVRCGEDVAVRPQDGSAYLVPLAPIATDVRQQQASV